MFKKFLALILSVVLVLTMAVGCSGGATDDNDPGTENGEEQEQPDEGDDQSAEDPLRVVMVTDIGGVNDLSFNQSAWEGLQKAEKDLGIEADYIESHQEADYAPNLDTALDGDYDLIWGIGYKFENTMRDAAEQNPDQKYAIVDFTYGDKTPDNVLGVVFKDQQSSFLVGYIAGKMTETNKVGFVGGMEGVVISRFDYGYQAGVKYANPDVEIMRQYAESFGDAAKAKAITTKMYQDGADIVFHAAGGAGIGVIEAAKEQDKYAIGVDRDQNDKAPDHVITSAMKFVGNGIYHVVEDLKEGKYEGGSTIVYGLEEGGVGIAPTSDKHVPEEILAEVEELKQKIIDGEIVVPENEDQYEEYIETLK
ncbi:BMP family lipoprotein [Clostridiisalibacter paucivorans]|uniref:BMP family lipoprotein n=1 Tax=Clostridiisalibacter paucivorans TaxID=408753 RepID=UPI00047D33E7|nr:BMP family ABC transporter substrate-binding protein [Clostridiisalibacter paucivorans]